MAHQTTWCWYALVYLLLVGLLGPSYSVKSMAALPYCINTDDNTTESCCLCYNNNTDDCDYNTNSCPDGFQSRNISPSDIDCQQGIELSTLTTAALELTTASPSTAMTVTRNEAVTTTDTENTTDSDGTLDTTTEVVERTITVCYKCDSREYFNDSHCNPCDQLCLQCKGPGSGNCSLCRFDYQGTCVERCPNDTYEDAVDDDGRAYKCSRNDTTNNGDNGSESGKFPTVIVAAAVGGGVVLILIVAITVFICRRRSQSSRKRSRMSQIIEGRTSEDNKTSETRSTASRRANYENQPDPGATFSRDIQNKGDEVLRYVQDPTAKKKKTKSKVPKQDDMETYANAPMIRVHKTFQNKTVSQERLQEELDHQEVSQLPQAPSVPVPSSKRKSFTQRLSQHLRRDKKKFSVPAASEEYIDMDVSAGKPRLKPVPAAPDDSDQEDYQNVKDTQQQITDENGMEDYENMKIGDTQDKRLDPRQTGGDSDQEDYENMSTLKKLERDKKKQSEQFNDTQESYENLEFTEQGQHSAGESNDDGDTGVDITDNQQEDYENTDAYRRNVVTTETGENENPYQNVEIRKK